MASQVSFATRRLFFNLLKHCKFIFSCNFRVKGSFAVVAVVVVVAAAAATMTGF